MTIPAKVSATEVTSILSDRYVGQQFQARLIDLPAYNYDPNVTGADDTLLAGEVPLGTAGYRRSGITYSTGDIGAYADGGVPLLQKATTFAHDGGGTPLSFSHVALTWSTAGVTALGPVTSFPTAGVDATYTNIPLSAPDRSGFRINITVASGVWTASINTVGTGYEAGLVCTIPNAKLKALDPTATEGNDLVFTIDAVDANGGVTALSASTDYPGFGGAANGADGTYTNILVKDPGDRGGLTVDITVASGVYTVATNAPGYGYADAEVLTITATDLNALDPTISTGNNDLVFSVASISPVTLPSGITAGDLFTVAKTTSTVNLTGGAAAAFYWNLKQYGFYTVAT